MQKKKKNRQNFSPTFRPQKFQPPPLFAMKIMGQPHRKECKLLFTGKFVAIFLRPPPLQGSTILRAPFLHQPPLDKCL